jgi:membrane-associated phospholipid phosphatase
MAGYDPLRIAMSPLLGMAVAFVGVLTGLAWQFEWGLSKDLVWFNKINRTDLWAGLDRFLIFIRPLGTKWALLMVLALVLIWQFNVGGSLAIAALLTAIIERGIKIFIKRPRPFQDHEMIIVRQNPLPRDPSFPSGDATRVWFLFAAILFGIQPAQAWCVLAGLTAAIVSFGRVRLGVHYPLDVWAGTGLGFGLGMAWSSFGI